MSNEKVISVLNQLTQINLASERGYNVAAENVSNRALKALFKTYAQERSQFADQLQDIVRSLQGEPQVGIKPLASLHRGWINLKAGMTIGAESTEKVVLSEVVRGESVAEKSYADALAKPLPPEVKETLQAQYDRICAVSGRVTTMCGVDGQRLVVRLFDSTEDGDKAIEEMKAVGVSDDAITRYAFNELITLYEEKHKGRTVAESAAAGSLVGGGFGLILGLIAGVSAIALPTMGFMEANFNLNVVSTLVGTGLAGTIIGLLFGAFMGAIIGVGIAEDDSHRYVTSVNEGSELLLVETAEEKAFKANEIMLQVNARRQQPALHSN